MKPSYTYKAEVLRVVDGDMLVARVDLGMRTFVEVPLRLNGINSRGLSTEQGGTRVPQGLAEHHRGEHIQEAYGHGWSRGSRTNWVSSSPAASRKPPERLVPRD